MDHKKVGIQGYVSVIQNKISLPVNKKLIANKMHAEAFPCIRMEASYMAETAVAIPFFTGFLMLLLFFFQILTVEQEVGNALFSTGRELSVMFCQKQEDAAGDSLLAQGMLIQKLPKDSFAEAFIKGGKTGISLKKSEFSENYIRLRADYKIRFPIGLFGKKEIPVTQNLMCRKWTGESRKDPLEEIVYVTKNGRVYHRSADCTYLKPSVESVDKSMVEKLRNADGGKYNSCRACMKGKYRNIKTVYITKYGDLYHGKRNCSRIKRTAFAIHLSEAKGKDACSKCGKE